MKVSKPVLFSTFVLSFNLSSAQADYAYKTQIIRVGQDTAGVSQVGWSHFTSQVGAFDYQASPASIKGLCILSNGVWLRAGSGATTEELAICPNAPGSTKPAASERIQIAPWPENQPYVGVRNLGLVKEEFSINSTGEYAPNPNLGLTPYSKSFKINFQSDGVRWNYDTQMLPAIMQTEIPGSGIHIHLGVSFSKDKNVPIFVDGTERLLVQLKAIVDQDVVVINPGYTDSPGGSLTVGTTFLTDDGRALNVLNSIYNRYNQTHAFRESVSSDGRNSYLRTFIGDGTRLNRREYGFSRSATWSNEELFSFSIGAEELGYAISQMNSTLGAADQLPTDVRLYKLSGVNARNEIGNLQRGTVKMSGKVLLLKVTRLFN